MERRSMLGLLLAVLCGTSGCQRMLVVTHVDHNWFQGCQRDTGEKAVTVNEPYVELQLRTRRGRALKNRVIQVADTLPATGPTAPSTVFNPYAAMNEILYDGTGRGYLITNSSGHCRVTFPCRGKMNSHLWQPGVHTLWFQYKGKRGNRGRDGGKRKLVQQVRVVVCATGATEDCFGE